MHTYFSLGRFSLVPLFLRGSLDGNLHETPGQGAAGGGSGASGGTPAGGGSPAGGSGQPTAVTSASGGGQPAGGGTPGGGQPGAGGAPRTYTQAEYDALRTQYERDYVPRRNYVPTDQVVEARRRADQLQHDLEVERNRTRALAGLGPAPSADEVERQRIREAMLQLVPELAPFLKPGFDPAKMERILAQGDRAEELVNTHWDNHAQTMFDQAAQQVCQVLNLENLSDRQFARLVEEFKDFSRAQVAKDPAAFRFRYERADPALISDFVKEFTDDWVAPARRGAVAGSIRPRVPFSGTGARPGGVTSTQPPITAKTPEEAEEAGIAYMRGRGVEFAQGAGY